MIDTASSMALPSFLRCVNVAVVERCGDGRVLVAAAQRTGCRGVGVDVAAQCIDAANAMVKEEDEAADAAHAEAMAASLAAGGDPGVVAARGPRLAELLTFITADCTAANNSKASTEAGSEFSSKGASETCGTTPAAALVPTLAELAAAQGVTCCFMYIYPTLLKALLPQIEALTRLPSPQGGLKKGSGARVGTRRRRPELSEPSGAPGAPGAVEGAATIPQPPPAATAATAAATTTTTTSSSRSSSSSGGDGGGDDPSFVAVASVHYHPSPWRWGADRVVWAARDPDMGPGTGPGSAGPKMELRVLSPAFD